MTPRLEYTQEELLATHDIEEPLFAAGVRCHGGFLADGTYVSPRTRYRMPAIAAWQENHRRRFGTEILEAPIDTWPESYPNVAQTKFLLGKGIREPVISTLTRIGTVEGFGSMLRWAMVPDLRRFFADDISGTATAHIERGLFEAHARDEAGHLDEAGHDRMWYAARDIAFENPVTQDETAAMLERMGIAPPAAVARDPEAVQRRLDEMRQFSEIDFGFEMMLQRMIGLLFIEVQAFHTFVWAEEVLADTDLVAGGGEAARLVSYIRQDEIPHVEYLKTALTEMRDRQLRTVDGGEIPGRIVIETLWDQALDWSLGERREEGLELTLREIERALDLHGAGGEVLEEFHSLGTIRPDADGSFPEVLAEIDRKDNAQEPA